MKTPEGWYLKPGDDEYMRYWTGYTWRGEAQPATEHALPFPGPSVRRGDMTFGLPATPPWATFIVLLSVVLILGALAGGFVLAIHSATTCDADGVSCVTTHPNRVAGIVIMTAGLLQGLFVASFASLHTEIRLLRIAVNRVLEEE